MDRHRQTFFFCLLRFPYLQFWTVVFFCQIWTPLRSFLVLLRCPTFSPPPFIFVLGVESFFRLFLSFLHPIASSSFSFVTWTHYISISQLCLARSPFWSFRFVATLSLFTFPPYPCFHRFVFSWLFPPCFPSLASTDKTLFGQSAHAYFVLVSLSSLLLSAPFHGQNPAKKKSRCTLCCYYPIPRFARPCTHSLTLHLWPASTL